MGNRLKPGLAGVLRLARLFCVPLSRIAIALLVGILTLAGGQQAGFIRNHTLLTVQQASAATAGLVAAYGFSEASGATTADASGNNNTGTLIGGVTRITAGKYGNALSFDGSSGVVRIPDSPTWKVNGLTGYTVSMWVNVKNVAADYRIALGKGAWPSNDIRIYKYSNQWHFGMRTTGLACGGETSSLGYLSTADNTYHHIALVMDAAGGKCDFYSDGQIVGTDPFVSGATIFATGTGLNDLSIGGLTGSSQYLNADIDETRLYTRALSQAEIQSDMNTPVDGPKPPDTTPPVISAVTAGSISISTATITWNTNEPSDSQVEYGLTTAYGQTTTLDSSMVTAHSQTLSGLSAGALHHFRVKSKDAAGNLVVSDDFSFTTATPGDTTPPVIIAVSSSGITHSGATISWMTDEPSDSRVEYGLTTAYGSTTVLAPTQVTSHDQILSSLSSNTLYHYRVHSKDASGNPAVSADFTFTTQPSPPDTTPPVISNVASGSVTSSSAVVSWTTDEPADSQVEYGTTTAYGSLTILNTGLVTNHSQTLSGLSPNTLYHYRAHSKDTAGNLTVSSDFNFTTQPAITGFQEVLIASGFDTPTAMEFAPDGRLFVAEKGGALRVIQNGQLLPTPFHTANVATAGEQGLLGIAFDPNFSSNQYVYIYYTATSPSTHNRLSRLTANGNVAAAGSEVALLDLPGTGTIAHQGGAIHFGNDGKLYVAVGDHQAPENAQLLSNPFGKILRINSDGTFPTDNPFYNQTSGINQSIYAIGFRNPFTFAVDPDTGRIFINDVGNTDWEEVDQLVAGGNFGWPTCEGPQGTGTGSCNNPGFIYPLHAYGHADGEGAVTGGAFYRSNQFPSQYVGDYFFADYTAGWIRFLDSSNQVPGIANPHTDFRSADFPVDLKVGPEGALYYLSIGFGKVVKIEYASGNRNPTAVIGATPTGGPAPLTVNFDGSASSDPDSDPLTYTWDFGDGAPNGAGVTASHAYQTAGVYTATLTVSDGRGGIGTAAKQISVGTPPVATILTPGAGTFYNAGDTIQYSGSATDADDGVMPASAFSWTIVFHHDTHTHPFLGPITGVTSGSFQIPQTGETSTNVWYRIHLTVTDSTGLTHEVTRDILPNVITLTLASNTSGAMLTLDGQPAVAPIITQSVVGLTRTIGAPSPQTIGSNQYAFVSWSDGGAATHTITSPAVDTAYTATFQQVGPIASDWFYPSAQSAVTSGSGDNDGYEGAPANLFFDDGVFATDANSGKNNNSNCGNSDKDRHIVRDFTLTLPGGTTTVKGLEVRLDAKVDSNSNAPKICVQLSWDGGTSWTSAKSTPSLSISEQTFILGNATDLWGRSSWTTSQLSNTNFRVRVTSVASSTARDFAIDVVGVRVTAQ